MKHLQKVSDIEKMMGMIRKEYHAGKLDRQDLLPDPFEQFARWLREAVKRHNDPKANVMVLATAAKGKVSSRCVLLKGLTQQGLLFYTHTLSLKARQLKANPEASVCFYWPKTERQVTVVGRVKRIPGRAAEIYFRSRPREAQICAWCTEQSKVIKSREALERRFRELSKKYEGREIPVSPNWAGFCLQPVEFEFWQGRANRLNDRFRYRLKTGRWTIERLQP